MNCAPRNRSRCSSRGAADFAGFTLAEVLAALVFLAIVIPVAVEGLRIASRAGTVGQRKTVATRIAENALQEWMVSASALSGFPRGTVEEAGQVYEWSLRSESWTEASMRLVTVEVTYRVQGEEYDLRLSTLRAPN